METEDKFKNSPIHDKRAILKMMDELRPEQMVKVVDFIQEQVKLFCQPAVIKSVCPKCKSDDWDNIGKNCRCNKCNKRWKQTFYNGRE